MKLKTLLWRKIMTNLDSIFKSRDITLPPKVHLVKALVFLVVMHGSEIWTIKKAERWRWCFEWWCSRRLLWVPWTARRSNQSVLKEMSPVCSLEGLMLKLKLQYFGYLMRKANSSEKTLMLGKIEGRRRWGRHSWLDGFTNSMDMGLSGLRRLVMDREAWRAAVHRVTKSRTWLRDWTELNWMVGRGAHFFPLLMCKSETFSLLYLNKAFTQKLWAIKPCHWPWIEFVSPKAKNPCVFHGSAAMFQK